MPTHKDETLQQRYEREHQDYLKLCGSMTAEQVADLQLQLNNALAREQALQAQMTAADERADALDTEWSRAITERGLLKLRADVLEGLVGEVLDAVGREPLDLNAVLRLRARMHAALKPAECCNVSAEDRALLNAGDYTPEELFGVGGKPSCPKCAKP